MFYQKILFKQFIRHEMCFKRFLLTKQYQCTAAYQIADYLLLDKRIKEAINIALYVSFNGEINTLPLIRKLLNLNKNIYLPVLNLLNINNLIFAKYTNKTPLVINKLGIKEPKLDMNTLLLPISKLDILFIPLVAFDIKFGYRLGMGKGFYDRILKYKKLFRLKFIPIGLAHNCQEFKDLPVIENLDMPLSEIITPSKHWLWTIY